MAIDPWCSLAGCYVTPICTFGIDGIFPMYLSLSRFPSYRDTSHVELGTNLMMSSFKKMIQLFIFVCAGSLLLHGLFSSCGKQGHSSLWCTGFSFSCCKACILGHLGFSRCSSQALEHRLSSCGKWALLLRSMWDLPRLGIEPVSPALASNFLPRSHQGSPMTSS